MTATERTRYVLARSRTGEAIQDVAKPLRYYADLDGWITQHVETDGTMKFGGSTGSREHTSGTDEKYEWVKFPLVLGQRWFFIAYNRSTSGRRETFDYACHTSRASISRATTWP